MQDVTEHRNDVGEIEKRGTNFVHRSAGYAFPAVLGAMPARKTITFAPQDAEVYYTLKGGANGDAWLSLYVYPARLSLAEEDREVQTALQKNLKGGAVLRPSVFGDVPSGAVDSWYDGEYNGIRVITGYTLVKDGKWFIKVRLSVPSSGGKESMDRAAKALGDVSFTIAKSTERAVGLPSAASQ